MTARNNDITEASRKMSSNKLVALVGHSLVPSSIGTIDDTVIRTFRSPGVRVTNFDSNSTLNVVLNWRHDILFIGGNDINDNCISAEIPNNIIQVVERIHVYCNSYICLVLIKHRNPSPNNRFNVTTSKYNRIANNINNRLKRKLKKKDYVSFISVSAEPFQVGVTDGVYFDEESKAALRRKFRNAIKHCLDH